MAVSTEPKAFTLSKCCCSNNLLNIMASIATINPCVLPKFEFRKSWGREPEYDN